MKTKVRLDQPYRSKLSEAQHKVMLGYVCQLEQEVIMVLNQHYNDPDLVLKNLFREIERVSVCMTTDEAKKVVVASLAAKVVGL